MAFGLAFALDDARRVGELELEDACTAKAQAWYGADRDAPAAGIAGTGSRDYLGEHWLATFAVLALEASPGALSGVFPGAFPGLRARAAVSSSSVIMTFFIADRHPNQDARQGQREDRVFFRYQAGADRAPAETT